jgi:hypothetical protein
MDMIDGIIVGAAAAAIGSIVAYKFMGNPPEGGGLPQYSATPSLNATSGGAPAALVVPVSPITPIAAAPVQNTIPITEAAFNQYPVTFEHAFGPSVNRPTTEENEPLLAQ